MVESLSSSLESEKLQTRKDIFKLLESPVFKKILKEHEVKWVSKPSLLPELDIAFVGTKFNKNFLKSLSILGLHHCVGFIISPDDNVESVAETYKLFQESQSGKELLAYGHRAAVLTRSDIKLWQNFYQVVDEKNLVDLYGNRAHELSGLERYSQIEAQKYLRVFHRLMSDNWQELSDLGVDKINFYQSEIDKELCFDLAFLDKNDQLVPVSIYYVRELLAYDGLLVEQIKHQPSLVPGFVVRRAGESKRDAYRRAAQAKDVWSKDDPEINDLLSVPVVSGGQVSVWDKLDPLHSLSSSIEKKSLIQNSLTVDQLLSYLFMGDNSVERGELGRLGYSLPGNPGAMLNAGNDIGIDLLFLKRNEKGERELTVLDNLVTIGETINKNGQSRHKVLKNVAGMVIVPEDWSQDQVKDYIKSAEVFLRRHHPSRHVQVVAVNQELFDFWQQRRSIFYYEDNVDEESSSDDLQEQVIFDSKKDSSKKNDTYFGNQALASQMWFLLVRGEAIVGGNSKFTAEVNSEEVNLHAVDIGVDFSPKFKSSNNILTQSTTNTGILSQLNDQAIPMIPGLYALEYIKASAKDCPAFMLDRRQPVYSYLRAELAKRASDQEISDLGISPQDLRIVAENDLKLWYQGKDWELQSAVIQHTHWDHTGNLPLLSEKAKILASRESIAELWYMTKKSTRWSSKPLEISLITQNREKAQGSPYQVESRPTQILEDGKKHQLSSSLAVTNKLIGHSIPGSMMQLWEGNGQSLLLTGDVRIDDYGLTESAIDFMAGKPETIIMETTNGPGVEKASAGIKESAVRANLVREIGLNPKQTIIVVTPPNHVERMNSIFEAAEANHRHVAMSGKHLELFNQLKMSQSGSLEDIRSFPYRLPEIGEDVAYWLPNHSKLKTYEEALRYKADGGKLGIVDLKRLSYEPEDWVIVVSPYEDIVKKTQGLHAPKGIKVIWSSYYLYDASAKELVTDIDRRLKERRDGSEIVADYRLSKSGYRVAPETHPRGPFHASGHATYPQMRDQVLVPLLGPMDTWADKTIILTHGADPGAYAGSLKQQLEEQQRTLFNIEQNLKRELGSRTPKIIWQLSRYDSASPFSDKNPFGLKLFSYQWA